MKRENLLKKIEKNNLTLETRGWVDIIIINENISITIFYSVPSEKTNARFFMYNDHNNDYKVSFRTFGEVLSLLKAKNYIAA